MVDDLLHGSMEETIGNGPKACSWVVLVLVLLCYKVSTSFSFSFSLPLPTLPLLELK